MNLRYLRGRCLLFFYHGVGIRVIGYDNERGKGDHRHINGLESPYIFSTPLQLMTDFQADLDDWQKGEI